MTREEKIDNLLKEHKAKWRKEKTIPEKDIKPFASLLKMMCMGEIKPND